MMNENYKHIPAEKFSFAQKDKKIHDAQLETKPIGYFKDAWLRFRKNKSAVVAFALILFLMIAGRLAPVVFSSTPVHITVVNVTGWIITLWVVAITVWSGVDYFTKNFDCIRNAK